LPPSPAKGVEWPDGRQVTLQQPGWVLFRAKPFGDGPSFRLGRQRAAEGWTWAELESGASRARRRGIVESGDLVD